MNNYLTVDQQLKILISNFFVFLNLNKTSFELVHFPLIKVTKIA